MEVSTVPNELEKGLEREKDGLEREMEGLEREREELEREREGWRGRGKGWRGRGKGWREREGRAGEGDGRALCVVLSLRPPLSTTDNNFSQVEWAVVQLCRSAPGSLGKSFWPKTVCL